MIRDETERTERDPTVLLGWAALAWAVGMISSALIAQAVSAAAGWNLRAVTGVGGPVGELAGRALGGTVDRPVPLVVQLLFNIPLWLAFGVAVAYGATMDAKLAERLRPTGTLATARNDLVIGVIAGLVSQFGLLLVIYQLVLRFVIDPDSVDDAARSLTDQIRGFGDLVVLLVLVGFVAPVVEELFFRGLVYRGFEGLGPRWMAVVGSAFVFAAVHLQVVQFAGLFAFGAVLAGLLAATGRLGASIWAHITFNVATVVLLGLAAL